MSSHNLRGEAGQKLCLALILVGLAAALVAQAWRTGVTVDAPAHLLSSSLYWHGADRLQPRDMPPLMKIVGGWAPALIGLPVPYDQPVWKDQHEWTISLAMMERMNAEQIQRVFFFARLPLLMFPLLTAFLLWRWARELFGGWVAVLVTLAFALEPTALAHGSLFKNDLASTFGYLLFWYTAWRFWRDPVPKRAAWFGMGLLVALLAKLSMLVLVVVAPAIVLLRMATMRRAAVLSFGLVLLIPYLGLLAAYQFEARTLSWEEVSAVKHTPEMPYAVLTAARVLRVLPAPMPMWQGGLSLVRVNAIDNPVYLWGRTHPQGHPAYFLAALAVKAPVPIQILVLCGVILVVIRMVRRKLILTDLFWLAPPLLYIGLASTSAMQLGVRLILPALPFGLLLCGPAIEWMMRGQRTVVLFVLLAWLGVQSARIYPHGIAYFNELAGGPEQGLKYLADSNLDWGQNLRTLAEYVEEAGIPKLRLFYFGTDSPWAYFKQSELELLAPPWGPDLVKKGEVIYAPEPGYYAISATLLPGHFFQAKYRDFYRRFREMEPVARVGYSIYLYKVN